MARNISGLKSASVLSAALFAVLATAAFAQSPALVPRDQRPFTPPDTQAPPPRATTPAQQPPPAQAAPAQAQAPVAQMPSPASQGMATIAPPPLMQKPAVSPTVGMRDGLLSIDASNSNLSDVLTAVRRATGAVIEGANAATERVVVHLGPGRPNEVISALLSGSRYDYVLLGSAQQPGAVTRIMLSVRQSGDQVPSPQAASNVHPAPTNTPDDDGAQEDSPEQREQDVRQPEPPAGPPPQGNAQPGQPGQPQNSAQPGAQNSDQPKTPQQLFEEIQRMQQQRQQDQQEEQRPQQPPPPQD